MLVVANHLSWIDALALCSVAPLRIVAKREIRGWPVLGLLMERAGSVFVDRAGLGSLPSTVMEISDVLRGGDAVGVFPEGTTYCGAADIRFRRAPFQAAIDAGACVRPVAIALRLPDGRRAPAAYVAEGTWWDDVCRIVRIQGLRCELIVLPLLADEAVGTRRELAMQAQSAIADALGGRGSGVNEIASMPGEP
ncbi:MAG: 1-acyl-sn-glycerol-3-phosphate acyltransferase [Pseudonocardia sp.]|nr:1-acyl-sn-glycerol-3-phosphate acyltransferase [Pseudonocardia sp.]